MRVYLDEKNPNTVFVEAKNRNDRFFWYIPNYIFDEYSNGNYVKNIAVLGDRFEAYGWGEEEIKEMIDPEESRLWSKEEVGSDLGILSSIIGAAEINGIPVENGVYSLRDKLLDLYEKACQRAKIKAEKEEKKKRFECIKKHGCEGCKYLSFDIDVPICNYTGDRLKDEPISGYDENGVYCLYRGKKIYFVDGCYYKKEVEEDERYSKTESK